MTSHSKDRLDDLDQVIAGLHPTLWLDPERGITADANKLISAWVSRVNGYSFTQTTDANKPVWSRADNRENFILDSGDATTANWDATTYPVTVSGSSITATAANDYHAIITATGKGPQLRAGATYRIIADVTYGNYQWLGFGFSGDAAWHWQAVNLSAGTLGTSTNVTGSIETISAGRYRITLLATATNTFALKVRLGFGSAATDTSLPQTNLTGSETFTFNSLQVQTKAADPVYIATGSTAPIPRGLNGRRCIYWPGVSSSMSSSTNIRTVYGNPFTNIAVLHSIGGNKNTFFADQYFQTISRIQAQVFEIWLQDATKQQHAFKAAASGKTHVVYGCHANAGKLAASVDGAAGTPNADNLGLVNANGALTLGNNAGDSDWFGGYMGPILCFNTEILPSGIDRLHKLLARRYGAANQ